ncbi:WD repeat domain 62 isoform X2 [Leptinotarsa decemlineata]|uniref:WD repeat domain 62 isoform X2 n=1 Tax=Leptinotarsa decemlineata TaxID=7539 RepID=UPI003D306C1C
MMPRNSSPIIEKDVLCTYQIKLERVLGVTVSSNAALTSDNNGLIAYPAGCTVVLFNTRTEQQSHIINTCRKTVTSLAFSSCGRYIVTGECGHQPAVRIWDLQSDPQSGHPGLAPQPQQVAEFLVHKFGINCVAFSPTGKYVVSIGTQHDMIVNVWDWKNNIKVASNKISTKVKSIAFAENGSYFVTVGNRHVKFWYLEHGNAKYKDTVPLMGRSAILGDQRNNYFCDVACGKADSADSTYVITRSGLLCEFNNRRLLDKWVELRTSSANCITVGEKYIFVGCAEGIIRCFDPATLRFVTTLPRNHYLGVDVSLGTSIQHMATPPPDAKYPDTVAITFDETNNKLTSVYNDHSIYVWDVFNIQRVGKSHSFLYHSACIWGVEMAPPNSPLPPGSFLTCSSDDTIRVWTLDKLNENNSKGMYQSNIYSNELLKVVYVDKDLSFIKDLDISGTTEKQENTSYDGRNGVRCIRVSPDGKHLASGDRAGNIRIHDSTTMKELIKIEAHDAEVLCLEYSDTSLNLMASASRDRLIHVFDMKERYEFLQTLDDHSSSITAVRFLNHGGNTQMVSCGADKSLIFRTLGELNDKPQFIRANNATGKTTLYDMEVDTGQKHVLTACQDRNVRIYSVNTGKHTKSFKGSTGDDGTLIKVVLDRSGIYLATSCTDKSLSVYDYYSGECMATMCGHSELATGLRFTNDCRRLISASGDGCIFVWRVPHDMVVTMHARLSQQAMRQGKQLEQEMFSDSSTFDFYDGVNTIDTNYRFSIGQLPQWAKKQLTEDTSQPSSLNKGVAIPKGRWAQRAENAMGVKSFYSNSSYPFPPTDRRFDSDGGSKDSSLDSGTEIKNYSESRREIVSVSKLTTRVETRRGVMTDDSAIGDAESTAHDGDIDSDNDYRHRPIYYPTQTGSQSGGEFTVTNIDADELRKSQRKKKAPQIVIAPTSTCGSNDSDDDDDEASTPSGENTDRNPMSLFSLSSESLDQLVSRERYLQSTFESMSGMENEVQTPTNKSSISSKFLTQSVERNQEAIKAVKQTKNDPDAIRKRQELNKRVAETRKKLESVGHSSPLKYSQSIHDLSHIPERDRWSKKQVYVDESSPDSSLRRSCSLSDLSMPLVPKRKIEQVSGKKNSNNVSRNNSRYVKNNSITRSRSSGVLNHSDSDPETQEKKVSRLMRPTISSYNKVNNKTLQSRKKHSYSTSNLNTVGTVDNISTSDEESPTAPPRNRQLTFDKSTPLATPRRHLNNKEKSRAKRHTIHFDDTLTNEDFDSNESFSSVEISNQLCDDLVDQLTNTAENVVKLYDRLNEGEDSSESQIERLDRVKMSMIRTHKILHDCIFKELKQNNGSIDVNQTDTVKKLNDLVSKGPSGPNSVISIMEQYSDILLDMVQQKIHNANI